ncbi:uncharacterized protein PGTG_17793 [Puccinia graminis f. sp. tritici CRL 75-36-700-3]|uniref:Uncharacterized protein n=1 Tax=Puccinia graminis f. sp. tritici (strain CRL 75-36-700-3 / race SCCL) TaxID=418459 RepID=E3L5G8_PUCGT|nr:uncharacterized protein PGTG_17793 [Puccinia graminis f. sp. tritici CRL 75-36-700-3]EFP91793.1 hypothetical protein PGTG_17793 [Puccinia graminis f. sp. tritici CRL 75-36-700-3]
MGPPSEKVDKDVSWPDDSHPAAAVLPVLPHQPRATPPVQKDVQVAGFRGLAPGQQLPQLRASQARAPPQIKGQPQDVLVEHPRDVPPKHPTDGQEVFEGRLLQKLYIQKNIPCGVSEPPPTQHLGIFLATSGCH